ncbi:hypothetical protein KQX54_010484 [Cotesia glomerata]|uniref:Uncharacterized protein n=1 Tax=Cotesia glomerata TaxID=32391 RepID=A0AAV7J4L4_COTGL|nr:hypothetical protein KQX54_010484 [Cotesia glomerata]
MPMEQVSLGIEKRQADRQRGGERVSPLIDNPERFTSDYYDRPAGYRSKIAEGREFIVDKWCKQRISIRLSDQHHRSHGDGPQHTTIEDTQPNSYLKYPPTLK